MFSKTLSSQWSAMVFTAMIFGIDMQEPKSTEWNTKSTIKKLGLFLINLYFLSYSIFIVIAFVNVEKMFALNAILLVCRSLTIMARMAFLLKKKQIRSVVQRIRKFENYHSMAYRPQKRYIILILFCCISIDLVVCIYFTFYSYKRNSKVISLLLPASSIGTTPEIYERLITVTFSFSYTILNNIFLWMYCAIIGLLYLTFNEHVLNSFTLNLRQLKMSVTPSKIEKCLYLTFKMRSIYEKIEDAISFISFTVFGLQFTKFLFFVYKYAKGDRFFNEANMTFIPLAILWFLILSHLGSNVTNRWQENLKIVEEAINLSCFSGTVTLIDRMNLMVLLNCTKRKLCYTCWGIIAFDKSLIFHVIGLLVTYSFLLLA